MARKFTTVQKDRPFRQVSKNQVFTYDGDRFVKTDRIIAWEVPRDPSLGLNRIKEWVFQGDEMVTVEVRA